MADYLVQEEDGISKFDLEEDTASSILLEESGGVAVAPPRLALMGVGR